MHPIYRQALMAGAAAALSVLGAHLTAQLQPGPGTPVASRRLDDPPSGRLNRVS